LAKSQNGFGEIAEPIPDNKPDNKPDTKEKEIKNKEKDFEISLEKEKNLDNSLPDGAGVLEHKVPQNIIQQKEEVVKEAKQSVYEIVPPPKDVMIKEMEENDYMQKAGNFYWYWDERGWKLGGKPIKNWLSLLKMEKEKMIGDNNAELYTVKMKSDFFDTDIEAKDDNWDKPFEEIIPPRKSLLQTEIQANGYKVNPGEFYYYYDAIGWEINGRPITNWVTLLKKWNDNILAEEDFEDSYEYD